MGRGDAVGRRRRRLPHGRFVSTVFIIVDLYVSIVVLTFVLVFGLAVSLAVVLTIRMIIRSIVRWIVELIIGMIVELLSGLIIGFIVERFSDLILNSIADLTNHLVVRSAVESVVIFVPFLGVFPRDNSSRTLLRTLQPLGAPTFIALGSLRRSSLLSPSTIPFSLSILVCDGQDIWRRRRRLFPICCRPLGD
jgi:hypothetical protein